MKMRGNDPMTMKSTRRWALASGTLAVLTSILFSTAGGAAPRERLRDGIAAPARPGPGKARDFGSSGLWSRAGDGTNVLRDLHATRAMDLIQIRTPRSKPLLIEDVSADRVRHFLDIYDQKKKPTVSNLTVQRIQAGFTKRGIRLRYGSNGIVIRDFRLTHLGPNRFQGDIPVGIGMLDDVHNVLVERGVIENVLTELPNQKKYWNADGISMERRVHDVVLRDLVIRNCSDGGIDSKATNVVIDRVRVEGCTRSLRLWEDAKIGTFESIDPVKHGGTGSAAHIGLYNGVSNVTIGKLVVRSTKPTPIFLMESKTPATVVVDSQDIRAPKGTPLVGGTHADLLKVIWKSGPPRL